MFTFYETFHASFLILLAFLSSNVQNICILLSFGGAAAFVCIFLRNGLFSRPLQCMACLHLHICTLNICLACLCSTLHIMLCSHTSVQICITGETLLIRLDFLFLINMRIYTLCGTKSMYFREVPFNVSQLRICSWILEV